MDDEQASGDVGGQDHELAGVDAHICWRDGATGALGALAGDVNPHP
ncbi:hypothetical protein AB0K00_09960 [Dactylosporangium sp. NPDC049525]